MVFDPKIYNSVFNKYTKNGEEYAKFETLLPLLFISFLSKIFKEIEQRYQKFHKCKHRKFEGHYNYFRFGIECRK